MKKVGQWPELASDRCTVSSGTRPVAAALLGQWDCLAQELGQWHCLAQELGQWHSGAASGSGTVCSGAASGSGTVSTRDASSPSGLNLILSD